MTHRLPSQSSFRVTAAIIYSIEPEAGDDDDNDNDNDNDDVGEFVSARKRQKLDSA